MWTTTLVFCLVIIGICSARSPASLQCAKKMCEDGTYCAETENGPTCVPLWTPKPGFCPTPWQSSNGDCSATCNVDGNCEGDKKCCYYGCNLLICVDPMQTPKCSDTSCEYGDTCIQTESGYICLSPRDALKIGDASNIGDALNIGDASTVGDALEIDRCSLPFDVGPCEGIFPRYYFDAAEGECLLFNYGGCEGNTNNFKSIEECSNRCAINEWNKRTEQKTGESIDYYNVCTQPKKPGSCRFYCNNFYFDVNTLTCKDFVYYGCGGNKNRFMTQQECTKSCGGLLKCPVEENITKCKGTYDECADDRPCSHPLSCCQTSCGSRCVKALPGNN